MTNSICVYLWATGKMCKAKFYTVEVRYLILVLSVLHRFLGTVVINCNPLISDIVVVSYQKIANINL